jgi:glyoxylase I family protein
MAVPLSLGPIHHLRLTVTDVERSRVFYTELLGFQIAMDAPPPADDPHHDLATDLLQDGIVMVNGDVRWMPSGLVTASTPSAAALTI